MKRSILILAALMMLGLSTSAQNSGKEDILTISDMTKDFTSVKGYINYYFDQTGSKIFLEVTKLDEEFLMVSYLSRGMGSNDVGLDRGKIGAEKVVAFQRSGDKVFLIEPNYRFRAESEDELERRAVEESFARSVIWGFKVEAEENGKILIDFTPMLLSDQNHVSDMMNWTGQGIYKVDASRSGLNASRTKNFPKNTEFDAILTFSGQPEGRYVNQVVPTPEHMTLGQHLSFVKLPELGGVPVQDFHPWQRIYQPGVYGSCPTSGGAYYQTVDLPSQAGEERSQR